MKKLLILGPGCARCKRLTENAEKAAKSLGVEYELIKVTDLKQISALGVMATPALVVDGNIKVTGKVASVDEIKQILV
jgi:small redox-active disulfide protein 2